MMPCPYPCRSSPYHTYVCLFLCPYLCQGLYLPPCACPCHEVGQGLHSALLLGVPKSRTLRGEPPLNGYECALGDRLSLHLEPKCMCIYIYIHIHIYIRQGPGRVPPPPRSGSTRILPPCGFGGVWVPFSPACVFAVGLGHLPSPPVGLGPLLWMKNLWRRTPTVAVGALLWVKNLWRRTPLVGPRARGPGNIYIYIYVCMYVIDRKIYQV